MSAHTLEAVARVYRVLQYHRTPLSVDEIVSEAAVTRSDAREACDTLCAHGLVVRYGAFPELRYRAIAIAEPLLTAQGRAYRAELVAALQQLSPDQERSTPAAHHVTLIRLIDFEERDESVGRARNRPRRERG